MSPTAQYVASADRACVRECARVRCSQRRNGQQLSVMAAIHIALQGNFVRSSGIPVAAEASAQRIPIVRSISTDLICGGTDIEIFCIGPVESILINSAAVSEITETSEFVAATRGSQAS